jgi:hypothetical protein
LIILWGYGLIGVKRLMGGIVGFEFILLEGGNTMDIVGYNFITLGNY